MKIIDQIRATAAANPFSTALNHEGASMSYDELMQRVDKLAAELNHRRIGAGNRVAIVLPRSFEMIIAILGVMASGATYVPLDPSNPKSRITTTLDDCNPSLVLGDEVNISNETLVNSESAYIIYTSGSTGKPKGVEVSCAALENYVDWAVNALPFTGGGVPLFTSISFDHAITNIFPPLIKGETIFLLPLILGGRALASGLLTKQHYSYVKITPSLFSFLNKDQRAKLGQSTNLLMFGGEKLSPDLIADARRNNPALQILNHYGPTEATVGCCVYEIPLSFSAAIVPIGKPIPGVKIKIDTTGELFIGGKALANGYWQQPGLTNKSFILADEQRWYRTGDLVRKNDEGNIEYLGRIDDQIKILGNRIEPAEIVAHLNKFPGVKQSTVFANEHELVAAISFFDDKPAPEEIRKYLLNILPPAMVPARYLLVDEIPTAASGKTDIKQIQNLPIEEAVSNKFKEILCLQNIGVDDDYFLLGGDSLGTVEIATWAAAQYKIPLNLACVFDFPTVGSLSEYIREFMPKGVSA